jgi:hypothetical protein
MLPKRKPSAGEVHELLRAQAPSNSAYAAVGATADAPLAGRAVDRAPTKGKNCSGTAGCLGSLTWVRHPIGERGLVGLGPDPPGRRTPPPARGASSQIS